MTGDLFEAVIQADTVRDTRLKVVKYRGEHRLDIRVYADVAGQRIPTKRGVSLPISKLDDLVQTLLAAKAKALAVSS